MVLSNINCNFFPQENLAYPAIYISCPKETQLVLISYGQHTVKHSNIMWQMLFSRMSIY